MLSINESLQHKSVTSMDYVQRFSVAELKKVHKIMDDAANALVDLIEGTKPLTKFSKARYKALLKNVTEVQGVYNREIKATMTNDMKKASSLVAKSESVMIKNTFAEVNLDVSMTKILPSQVWGTVTKNPVMFADGTTYSVNQAVNLFNVKNTRAALSTVQQGYLLGETNQQIAARLVNNGIYQGRKGAAQSMVRTITSHMSSASRRHVYEENTDLVYGYQWVSTLDKRTTHICQSYDGQVHIYKEADIAKYGANHALLPGAIYPPAHYMCRSTTTPLTRSWKDLGVPMDEKAKVPQNTRASMDGQVPATLKYDDWFKNQPAAIQKDIIGPTRYKLWKAGDVSDLSTFRAGTRLLPLDKLAKRLAA